MVRNKYNFVNSFWMKTDKDNVGYYRIRIWNRIEKINKNRIRMYPLYYHIKFEYEYGYPYWCLIGYEYRIIRISGIRFPSLGRWADINNRMPHTCAMASPFSQISTNQQIILNVWNLMEKSANIKGSVRYWLPISHRRPITNLMCACSGPNSYMLRPNGELVVHAAVK